jgi:hypothetical protein
MPSNVKYTADHLKLASDEFDYTQPSPQAAACKCTSHLPLLVIYGPILTDCL